MVKGFYSERGGEESAIAADELYNFHFVKRSRVSSTARTDDECYFSIHSRTIKVNFP